MTGIPLKKGLFHIPESKGDSPYLIGSRCRDCGYACFPAKEVCVRCRRTGTMEVVRLGPRATLETFAVMQVGTLDFPPPYVVGYVRTTEGVLVFTPITGCDPNDDGLTMGDEMELVIERIKVDEKGNDLLSWKFRPVRKKQR